MPDLANALIYYLVFLFSTTVHEAAHAWAALLGGDPTAYHGGQVSLDPRPHIRREPAGMLIIPLISAVLSGWPMGFASAPYDPEWARRHPRRAAWMALAGPGANLLLVLLAFGALRLGAATGVFVAPDSAGFDHLAGTHPGTVWAGVAFLLSVVLSLNLVLAVLNLFPFPPLDGSGALPLLLTDRATRRYQDFIWGNRALGIFGILIAWQLFSHVFDPVFLFTLNLLYPGAAYH
ncbi:MAG TPA: site-2 protease family protein [Gemmatimonadales bacterium]|jgi:Zn-dependent protease|nr:site-2 protease family protein [Gemmatimonadales bacterium]